MQIFGNSSLKQACQSSLYYSRNFCGAGVINFVQIDCAPSRYVVHRCKTYQDYIWTFGKILSHF